MQNTESTVRDGVPGVKDAIRHLEKYLDDECCTEFHRDVCRLAIDALRDRQAREADCPRAPEQPREAARVRGPMRLKLDITFATDGDFCFDNADRLFDDKNLLYENASVTYGHWTDSERSEFRLDAQGNADACQYAAHDLLETLVCSLRTSRYYVIQDVYRMLITAKDRCLWNGGGDVDYSDTIGGNYEGTRIHLSIMGSC